MNVPRKAQLTLIVSSGLFLGLVLFFYEAFGIEQGVSFSGHTLIERVLYFSLGVSITFAFNELVVLPKIKLRTVYLKALWYLWEILLAGSVTYLLFNYFWNFTESYWSSYFLLLAEFASVMIIPFVIYFLLKAKENSLPELLVFESANGKDRIAIQLHKLMYVKSDDNYVSIVYQSQGKENSSIIRRRLSDIEENYPNLIRIHRSYLVNPLSIHRVEEKPKNVLIYFEIGSSIPVSSSYVDRLRKKINHHSGS